MAAALGCELVLDHDGGEPGTGIALHGAPHVGGIAVTCVAVADDGKGDGIQDVTALIEHLGIGDEPGVRQGRTRRRYGKAAHEGQGKTGLLDEPRREGIEAAGHAQQIGSGQELPQPVGGGIHAT